MNTHYSIDQIATLVHGKVIKKIHDSTIEHLLIDSRKIYYTDNSLFFAIEGDRHNGHQYIQNLIARGVKNFVISNAEFAHEGEANFILVDSTTIALQLLAQKHREQFAIPVIGITGSNGKTTVKEWLYQLLKDQFIVTRNPKSYNSQVGVPLSAWLLNENTELAIFEAGISKPNEMGKLFRIIQPTIGLITNIGAPHDEGFFDREEKTEEKLQLFNSCEALIYCKDHSIIDELAISKFTSEQLFTWSTEVKSCPVYITSIEKADGKSNITFNYQLEQFNLTLPFIDNASIENCMHCLCVLLYLKMDPKSILSKFNQLSPIAMRLELKEGINDCSIINDSYNSDINSLQVALDFLEQQKQHQSKTIILSDIYQSGIDYHQLNLTMASLINTKAIQKFIGIGPNLQRDSDLFKVNEAYFYPTTFDFLQDWHSHHFKNELILIKGARDFGFERIVKRLEQKVHETVLEINLSAMVRNLNYYQSLLKKETKLMAMVKAFSYGSGSFEIANILQFHQVDYLAVAYADEGVELRKAGITLPIMVMNPEKGSFNSIVKYNLEPEIYSFSLLGNFLNALENSFDNPTLPYPIHLKIDTGMHRLGFLPSEVSHLNYVLKVNKNNVKVVSGFSHLAASNDPSHAEFTRRQITTLKDCCRQIEHELGYSFIKHILNSGGIENHLDAQLDMVRLGIGLYGISDNPKSKKYLEPVSSLKSTISQIKLIEPGETVGYNRSAKITSPTSIAVVSIGYADGIDRKLGNGRGTMLVNGLKAKTIGDICMDMCMLDVSDIPCKAGDEVVVFNKDLTIENIAKTLDTIPYEVLTGISRRVNRIYFQE